MTISHSKPARRTNEDVFFDYYPRLLEWAKQITHGERHEAEDLVHDLYFRVSRISRSIDEIESPDSYLFRILRNLYYARVRRAGRDSINDLSIVDYDSVEQGLAAVDRRQLLFVREDLKEICRYACQRKSTSRSASVLILRFFLGYYASEVMKILQVPRYSVDRSLQVARGEARMFLERPGDLRFMTQGEAVQPVFDGDDSSIKLFSELKEAIFSTKEGACFAEGRLQQRYAAPQFAPFVASELAHLVSCKVCLDQVNKILDLPLLTERSPESALDRDDTSGPGGVSFPDSPKIRKAGKKGPSFKKLERRARELFEHRPESLQIVIDGEVRSSQRVTAEKNELHLKLDRREEPSFIEIFSEQGFCLAFLPVVAPGSEEELEQGEEYSFSDGRSLTLAVSFAADVPIVHVLYRDPVIAEEFAMRPVVNSEAAKGSAKAIVFRPFDRLFRVAEKMIGLLSKGFMRSFVDMLNPLMATVLICGTAAVILFVLSLRTASVMKPSDLLQRAAVAENATAQSGVSGVIVQSVRIQTPQRKTERTLYRDIQRRRRLRDKTLGQQDASLLAELKNVGIPWNDPLSAGAFRDWHDRVEVPRDIVKRPEKGLLTLTTTVSTGSIESESLTIREADFHAVKRSVELRNAGTIEVAELNYSVLPWGAVNPDIFDPLAPIPEVNGSHVHASLLPHLMRTVTSAEMDIAELSARLVLNRLGLDASSRVEISRNVDGVHVQGLVDTETQKSQLQTQLRLIPHLIPSILTVQEMETRSASGSNITTVNQSSDVPAAPSSLERYFTEGGLDHQEFSATTKELLDGAFAVKWETEQISTLVQRFATSATLPIEARTALGKLLGEHRTALFTALAREERALLTAQLIQHAENASPDGGNVSESLRKDASENLALCIELTSNNQSAPREARAISPELAATIAELRATALQISPTALPLSTSPGNAGVPSKND